METTTETVREPRRLSRPHEGRWLGGVAAALGEYFDLSPAIYRVAFAALALAGGTGILLYVAAWLVIPDEEAESSVAERWLRDHADRPTKAIGLALLALFAILALSEARWWPTPGNLWLAIALGAAAFVWWSASPHERAPRARTGEPGAATEPGDAPAAPSVRRQSLLAVAVGALIAAAGVVALLDSTDAWNVDWRLVLGAMVVLTGALVAAGAAAGLRVAGVAGLGVLLLVALAVVLAVRVPIFAGWGDRTVHPRSVAALASSYEHGIGDFTLDLRDVPLPRGKTHVKASLGIGALHVHVPRDATVEVDGHVTAGEVRLLGHDESGSSVHDRVTRVGPKPGRTLVLDTDVGLGLLVVDRG